MASSTQVKLTCGALILCIIVWGAPHYGEAVLDCGQVARTMAPCVNYLRGGPGPAGPCCGGVTRLNGLAMSSNDRKTACSCLKSMAIGIKGLNYGLAAGLPSKCGVSIPYPISPKTDCSKVH